MRRRAAVIAIPLAASLALLGGCSSSDEKAVKANKAASAKTASAKPKPLALALEDIAPLTKEAGTDQVISLAMSNNTITTRFAKNKRVTAWKYEQGKASQFKAREFSPAAAIPLSKIDLKTIDATAKKTCPSGGSLLTYALTSEHSLTLLHCDDAKEAKTVLIDAKEYPTIANRLAADGLTKALSMARAAAPKSGPLAIDLSSADAVAVTMPDATGPLGDACKAPQVTLPLTAKGTVSSVSKPECSTAKKSEDLAPIDLAKLDGEKTLAALTEAAEGLNTSLAKCQKIQILGSTSETVTASVTCTVNGSAQTATSPIN